MKKKKKKPDLVLVWNEKACQFAVLPLEVWTNSQRLRFAKPLLQDRDNCLMLGIVKSSEEGHELSLYLGAMRHRLELERQEDIVTASE